MTTIFIKQSDIALMRYAGDGQSRSIVWDVELPGFGVRVYPSGRKVFVYSYRINGRKRLMTIGYCSVFGVSEARDRARLSARKVESGVDPMPKKISWLLVN